MFRLKRCLATPYLSWRLIECMLIFSWFPSLFLYGNHYIVRPERLNIKIYFCFLFFILSFIFPVDRPTWQKKLYIAIEIILINLAFYLGVEFEILLYFNLAKACFILNRRDGIIAIILAGITNLAAYASILPTLQAETRAYIQQHGIEDFFDSYNESILNYIISYITICFFLSLLMFLLVAEAKSRKRAENLAKEVEILATVVERNRIARDIHDSLGHTLTTLGVQLELAQKLHGINSDRATDALYNAQQLADRSLQEVRNTISAIRDENFDLKKALLSLINQFQQDNSFSIQAQLDLPNFSLPTSHQVYCILKEALYNIQKHSQAKLVTINTLKQEQQIIIEIADNGIGFEPKKITTGSGLRGMFERSQLINAQLKIDTGINRGTRIQLIINN